MNGKKLKRKVLVIGLDGATFNVIEPLIRNGHLLNIKNLIKNGTHGPLKSSIPPVTVPAWKCYSTGKNPGKLGATTFTIVDRSNEKIFTVNSTSFKSPEMWDIFGESGLKSIVYNMPVTYPPKKINGILISGVGTPFGENFIYPKNLMKELSENLEFHSPSNDLKGIFLTKDPLSAIKKLIENRFSTFEYLIKNKEWDFSHFTLFLCDVIQHHFWTDFDTITEVWDLIDVRIKQLLSCIDLSQTNVFIISDHGFGNVAGKFVVDEWLIKEGYLKPKKSIRYFLPKVGNALDSCIYSLAKFFFSSGFKSKNLISYKLLKKVLDISERVFGRKSIDYWDWKKSKIFCLSDKISAQLYVNDKVCSKIDYDNLKHELESKLQKINSSFELFGKQEIYSGDYLENCPDFILLHQDKKYLLLDSHHRGEHIFNLNQGTSLKWTGTHRQNGIFIAFGPDIRKNFEISGTEIIDVAPTILHILGADIPRECDGKVLKNLFLKNSTLSQKKIKFAGNAGTYNKNTYNYSEKEKAAVMKKLSELGYF